MVGVGNTIKLNLCIFGKRTLRSGLSLLSVGASIDDAIRCQPLKSGLITHVMG